MIRGAWLLWLSACATAPAAHVGGLGPLEEPAAPCATGCSGPSPAEIQALGDEQIESLLRELSDRPPGTSGLAADTLLFHRVEVLDHLDRHALHDGAHVTWLRRELARDVVELGLRLVAEDGTLLGHRDEVIPLAEKQHLLLDGTGVLGRADVNGKVKRVGVKHLWARF